MRRLEDCGSCERVVFGKTGNLPVGIIPVLGAEPDLEGIDERSTYQKAEPPESVDIDVNGGGVDGLRAEGR